MNTKQKLAYLQHGKEGSPMLAEAVPVKEAPLWWQDQNLSFTASGYGSRVPARYMVQVANRWRRVYCCIHSNIGALFIGRNISDGTRVEIGL